MATTSLGARKPAPRRSKANQQSYAYLYLIPAFAVMAVIAFYPLVYQAIVSFTDFATKDLRFGLQSPQLKFIGLQNYSDIATGGLPVQNFEFFRVLAFDFWWALSNVALHVPAEAGAHGRPGRAAFVHSCPGVQPKPTLDRLG